eukprot:374754-Karenia_brevis.AAC.1
MLVPCAGHAPSSLSHLECDMLAFTNLVNQFHFPQSPPLITMPMGLWRQRESVPGMCISPLRCICTAVGNNLDALHN